MMRPIRDRRILTTETQSSTQVAAILALLLILAACAPPTPTPSDGPTPAIVKLLATVFISPTPDEAQLAATRAAAPPSATPPPAAASPSPTVYVGVFLGAVESVDEGPVINPALLQAPTAFIPATAASGCPAQADPLFGADWRADSLLVAALGCPVELVGSFTGTMQVFERGVMYGRPNGGEQWAVAPRSERFWYLPLALAPSPNAITPPPGLLPPAPAFSGMWQAALGLSDALGFARLEEQQASISTQRFQGGILLADGSSGQVFMLLADGSAHGPY